MRISQIVALSAALACTSTTVAVASEYKIIGRVKVPDGGFDYATFDPINNRVLFARTDFTTVIEAKTNSVSQLNSASRGHMAVPVIGTSLVVLPLREGKARIVDTNTDTVVADVPAGDGPDGAIYDSYSRDVYVMNHNGGNVTVVDPFMHSVIATIPVGGTLEFPASDDAGRIFDNVTSVPEIAVIDANAHSVISRYKLDGCKGASGLAYDADEKLLISSCGNGLAKVLDAKTGKEIASLPIGRGPDAVMYDSVRKVALIPCGGDGILEVISLADRAHISVLQHVPTQAGSRTGALDPKTGYIYLMASKPDPVAVVPPNGRGAPRLSGSYEVLIVGPTGS